MSTLIRIAATRVGKALLGLWVLALLVLIVVPIAGLFYGELVGNLAFVVLPVAVLLNLSIPLAYYVENGSVGVTKIGWIGIAIIVLLVTLSGFDSRANSDIWIFLTWAMLVLSFPASLIVSLAHMVLSVLSITIGTSYFSLVIEWMMYFLLGYMQWFVLLPHLWHKWKERRDGQNE